jgi:predicted membrane channel-forming protein YqfA (hemolysin III family)
MTDPIFLLQLFALLVLTIGLPAARARWRAGAGWVQIGCALVTWALTLIPIFFAGWSDDGLDDAFKVTAIFAIFFGWMAVPLIAVFYQATNTPAWLITLWQQRSQFNAP